MRLQKWEQLPLCMRTKEVKVYYEILNKKKIWLIFKRWFDIICALFLLPVLLPVMVFFAVWIKLDSPGPVFYRQERITQYCKKFYIYKFRTMVIDADKKGSLITLDNDQRITKVGRKIRKLRVDEIPQVFNVIKGDMSFVGTRPEVKKYVDLYTNEMYATLLLPAGITSNASIEFKDEEVLLAGAKDVDKVYVERILPEKMKWNLVDVRASSFFYELGICKKTVFRVLEKRG